MGYYDNEVELAPDSPRSPLELAQLSVALFVRLLGLGLLFVGLWAGVNVVLEAWKLYEEPGRIERFADAVEHGSNLDTVFASVGVSDEEAPAGIRNQDFRLSYFAAWCIALLLLVIIGGLAMSAIVTGAHLALYDAQVKKLSRQVVKEVRSLRRVA